ncbi:MAG: DNA translocase FtsK 4TM domain-containing protein [Bdellovibrionota bacterium]
MAKKRRSTSREKSQGVKTSIKNKEKAPTKNFSIEFLIFILTIITIFLVCSIVSWQPLEIDEKTKNLMGPLGQFIGTLLRGSLGWSSLSIVLCFVVAIYFNANTLTKKNKKKDETPKYKFEIRFISLVLSIVCLAAFTSLTFGATSGGDIGENVSGFLTKYIGEIGSIILTFCFSIILAGFSLNYTFAELVKISFNFLKTSFKYLFLVFPYYAYAFILSVFQKIFYPIKDYVKFLYPKEELEEEIELPKPKRRRNKITKEYDDDEEYEEEEDASQDFEILVKRGNARDNEKSIKEVDKAIRSAQKVSMAWCDDEKFINYVPPSLSLLKKTTIEGLHEEDDDELVEKSRIIERKLRDFGIQGHVKEVHLGPVITLFEFEPAPGVRVGKIASLHGDLAMGLKASSIRIIAPIPKKGTVGIEVPNKNRDLVRLRDILESEEFVNAKSILTVPIGKDIYGGAMVADIASMPHLLIAGATGTGKSVFINTLLISLLYRANPAELGLILVDPKILELSVYEGIPHLKVPVVTTAKQAQAVFLWAIDEMERRYKLMHKYGVRNIDGYNAIARGETRLENPIREFKSKDYIELREEHVIEEGIVESDILEEDEYHARGEKIKPLAKIVIVVDELADLMFSVGKEIEDSITRLAQKARAAGIHLILATQRPSVDVITGLIKANFPARISFRVSSIFDSKTILDTIGAEKLLGKGDMLYMQPGGTNIRAHGAFVSDAEVIKVINSIKKQAKPNYDEQIIKMCERLSEGGDGEEIEEDEDKDELYDKAVEYVIQKGQASTSMIQRVFRIGYNRAARIIDMMERNGIVGPMDGAKPREVFAAEYDDEDENVI